MNIFTAISCLFLVLISIFTSAYFKPEYESAFEADQQCHFEMSTLKVDKPNLGCDHDTETRQWLLFDAERGNQPAEVIKRYKY